MTLDINNVNKTYPGGTEAVRALSLCLEAGEVFGLVGPNGAGKSTLLKVVCGLLRAESGSVLYNGEDITGNPRSAARHIGLMPDPLGVYTDITAWDYLEFFARVFAIPEREKEPRIRGVIEELELEPWLSEEVETLSAGWQRRLALGRMLLADMPVLLLDEPAAGLDVSARKELLEIVRRLAEGKRTIMISSHILPELEDLADRFGIIDAGQWREIGDGQIFFTRHDLAKGSDVQEIVLRCSDPSKAREFIAGRYDDAGVAGNGLRLRITGGDEKIAELVAGLCAKGVDIYELRRLNTGLSDMVLKVLEGTPGRGAKRE